MPNQVKNIILVDDVSKYTELACVESDIGESEVDFNKLVPVPKEFNSTTGSEYIPKEEDKPKYKFHLQLAIKCKDIKQFIDIMQPKYKLTLNNKPYKIKYEYSSDEFQDLILKSSTNETKNLYHTISYIFQVYCKAKYGIDNWYAFHRSAWGCKWNASDSVADGTEFQTPWSTPEPWYKALAKKLDFIALYADEDLGSNCGVYIGRNGGLDEYHSSECNINSEAFARAIHGYLYDDTIEQDISYLNPKEDEKRIEELKNLLKSPESFLKNYLEDIDLPTEYEGKIISVLGDY